MTPCVTRRPFGSLAGSDVELYTLRAGQIELTAITLGGIITSLRVPDRDGRPGDVVLGHDRLEPYIDNRAYLGAIVGRYANRIAHGRFTLDGVDYQLAKNNGRHHLHGGICGFDRHIWHATAATTDHTASITFERVSPAGEEGYPGTLHAAVTYRVATGNIVTLRYEAETDAPTIVNLTQHTYFNLGGESSASILDHELTIRARSFLPVDSGLIPLATSTPVEGSCFDFTNPAPIGSRLGATHDQLRTAGGFDHNFILAHHSGTTIVAAELRDPSSGR